VNINIGPSDTKDAEKFQHALKEKLKLKIK